MLKPLSCVLLFLLATAGAFAQQRMLSGYLKDSMTHLGIEGATLTNSTTQKKVKTDASGFFRIAATPNDLLYASAPNYRHDTLRYSHLFQDTIVFYLAPSGQYLENVTVQTGYEKYQMDSAARRKDFEEAKGKTYPAIAQRHPDFGFGVALNMDRFKKKNREKRAAERVFDQNEQQAYIDFRFSPQLVTFYTGLKGEELLSFMRQYTPSYEWLRQHPAREQLIDYVSEKIKLYRQAARASKKPL